MAKKKNTKEKSAEELADILIKRYKKLKINISKEMAIQAVQSAIFIIKDFEQTKKLAMSARKDTMELVKKLRKLNKENGKEKSKKDR